MTEIAKALPWSKDAEQCVLGAILLDNEQIERCLDAGLKAGEFFLDQNRRIFRAMQEMSFDTQPIDLVTLSDKLHQRGELEASGGAPYLASLADGMPRVSNVVHYAKIVKQKARLRDLAHLGEAITGKALGAEDSAAEVLESAEASLEAMTEADEGVDNAPVKLNLAVKEAMPILERIFSGQGLMLGRSWGYSDLDKITAGKQEAEFVILAARPSVGKTALGMEFIRREAEENAGACWMVSLEMTRLQIVLRLLCLVAKVEMHRLRSGFASQEDARRIMEAIGRVNDWPVWISEPSRMTSLELVRMTRRMAERHKVKLVLVDYLQLLEAPGTNAYERISLVSRHAKRAAKILGKLSGGTLVACAQLNRGAANDEPRLEHLRDSGQIEQDADTIMFLWNEKMSDQVGQASAMGKWLRVAKQRQGPTDAMKFTFLGQWMGFELNGGRGV
jgi:replicative DNA helicase